MDFIVIFMINIVFVNDRSTFLNCGISLRHLKIVFSSRCLPFFFVSKKVEKNAKNAQKYTVFTLQVERFPKVQRYSKVAETVSKKWQAFTAKTQRFSENDNIWLQNKFKFMGGKQAGFSNFRSFQKKVWGVSKKCAVFTLKVKRYNTQNKMELLFKNKYD